MAEIEVKFLIQEPCQMARLVAALQSAELDAQPLPAVNIVDRYLDTPDLQVFQAGWEYRWRNASGTCNLELQPIARDNGGLQKRAAVEQRVAAFPNERRLPKGQVARHLGAVAHAKLHELFQVHNQRRRFKVRTSQGALIEIAIDHATITAAAPLRKLAQGRLEFDELEMELKEGAEVALREFAETMQTRFGLLLSRLSRFERGLQAVGLSPTPPSRTELRLLKESEFLRRLRARQLGKGDPAIDLVYSYLVRQFQNMLVEEPRAWEGLDPEGVHQMRVATRRVRAALRVFQNRLPTTELNGEFKWLAAVLGDVRDMDVYQDNMRHYISEMSEEDAAYLIDYQQHLSELSKKARKDLIAGLSSQRYQNLKREFADFLRCEPTETGHRAGRRFSIGAAAEKIIGKQYKRVLRDGRAITPDSPDDALHALRIDCKRLRYLFEFFQPIYGKKLHGDIQRLKRLQDVLGDFQDATVATEHLREYADQVPMNAEHLGQLLALGQLIQVQRNQAAEGRERFHKVWKGFDRKNRRKRVVAILR